MFRVFLKSKQLGPATKRWMVSYSSASTNRIIQRRCMHKSVIVRKNTNKNINQADDLIKSIEEKQLLEKQKKKDLQQNKHKKTTLWQKIKTEAVHYWHGTKLLGLEVRISSRLIYKLLQGTTLTRRENRQLHRTTTDIIRLVPFAVFVIVPFMELLLPIALKLFPNMLPSTFVNKKMEEEKKRKLLKVRIDMAEFLQETIAESSGPLELKDKDNADFHDFFRRMRMTGEQPTTEEILKFASQFEDELTLDNLSRPQLVSICRYMNIHSFGTDNMLKFHILNRMRQLKNDDEAIQKEGIDHLTTMELHSACAARGIRVLGNSQMKQELNQWLDLQLNHHVPSTLLILSRAFTFTDGKMTAEDALRATFTSLPDNLVNEAELQVLDTMGTSTFKQKLDVLEQQEELIEDEYEQEEKEEKARQQEKETEKDDTETKNDKDPGLTKEQKEEIHEALSELKSKVNVLEQRAKVNEIKFHHQDYKDLIEELKQATHNESNSKTLRLSKKLENMLNEIDKELDSLESTPSSTK